MLSVPHRACRATRSMQFPSSVGHVTAIVPCFTALPTLDTWRGGGYSASRRMTGRITGVLTANDVTLDTLAGDWRIVQLRTGHRFSADDVLTAWAAVHAKPEALRLLDLGSGLGSVGLLALWKLPMTGHLTMVEVQAVSHALACSTVAYNGLTGRVILHHQDLRTWSGGTFDLVTGSPPYLAVDKGV